MSEDPYNPRAFFSGLNAPLPSVFLSPQRYIQGPGVLNQLGNYLSLHAVKRVAVLGSRRALGNEGSRVTDSLHGAGIDVVTATFNGECSLKEINRQVDAMENESLDSLVAVGGGKTVDAGKCVAHRLGIGAVIAPTLASNDAPCSSLSAVYTADGAHELIEYFPRSPDLVVVDTDVVVEADERYLVAGMGDAMATWYEARVCFNNPAALVPAGARPTLAACAISEICAQSLYENGEAAAAAVAASAYEDSVEKAVEANTLLSGIGFESGGIAMAHPLALAYTHIDRVNHNYLHGEMVAMGTMAQLVLEQSPDIRKAATFFARVGLPIHLGQLSLSPDASEDLDALAEITFESPNSHYMPITLSQELIRESILEAHEVGLAISREIGDEAYRRLHA